MCSLALELMQGNYCRYKSPMYTAVLCSKIQSLDNCLSGEGFIEWLPEFMQNTN